MILYEHSKPHELGLKSPEQLNGFKNYLAEVWKNRTE